MIGETCLLWQLHDDYKCLHVHAFVSVLYPIFEQPTALFGLQTMHLFV